MKQTAEFLLEVGCEEIPAQMIARASSELKVILEKHFSAERILDSAEVHTYGASRRMVAVCRALRTRQPDSVEEVTGPPRSVAYDNVGRPTRAAESFAAKAGVPVSKLQVVSTPKGEYLTARRVIAGRLAHVLCGGDLTSPTWVTEDYLLDLEREAALWLLQQPKTQERIMSLLKSGKPLRN